MWRPALAVATAIILSLGPAFSPDIAAAQKPADDFSKLADEFVYGSLALDPVLATESGYHVHEGVQLDEQSTITVPPASRRSASSMKGSAAAL